MAIDVHTHVVPADFPAYAGRAGGQRWPQMHACDHPGHKTVVIGDKPFRTVSDHSWDVARRQQDMAAEDVQMQVLSPMPELLSYWFDADDALAMARHVNGTIAGMVAAAPQRFARREVAQALDREVGRQRAVVDGDGPGARSDAHARRRGLAAAEAQEHLRSAHRISFSTSAGFCAACGCSLPP